MRKRHDRVLIVDFGSQYTQLIARRIREIGVYSEIVPHDLDSRQVEDPHIKGIVLSGGPESVTESSTPRTPEFILNGTIPVLGICYGMQAMAEQLTGTVESSSRREFGRASLQVREQSGLFADMPSEFDVWMSHGDQVVIPPSDFMVTATTESAPVAAIANTNRHFYGLQFHPEVTHTVGGTQMLRNFVLGICGCKPTWTIGNLEEELVEAAREAIGPDSVLLALSGGVDSSVVAALLSRAVGKQLTCVFVDNGFLRKNERTQVERMFAPSAVMNLHLHCVDAADLFLSCLKGMEDPEQKRKAIGTTFIKLFEEFANRYDDMVWLAQGTIYPDVVESAGTRYGKSHVIKSHHNVGGLPDRFGLRLFEPLRELFKDEVRELGRLLGLPDALLCRHPFPGPGLAVRVIGEVTRQRLAVLREADAIFIEELRKHDYYDRVAQAFAVLLPVKSVGVTGDSRSYDPVVSLRAVETGDFMTATAANLSWEFIQGVSNRILNEVSGVSRVVYDVSSKPPATIEWE